MAVMTPGRVALLAAEVSPVITVTDIGEGSHGTSAASVSLTTTATVPVGDIIVVGISADNSGSGGASSISGVTDSAGNTYTQIGLANRDPGAANAGATAALYFTKVTTQLGAGGTITASFSPDTPAKHVVAVRLTNASDVHSASATNTGGSTTYSVTTAASVDADDVVIAIVAWEDTTSPGLDTDTTNGTWVDLGSPYISNMGTRMGYKLTTGASTQTFDRNQGFSKDWAAVIVAFPLAVAEAAIWTPRIITLLAN